MARSRNIKPGFFHNADLVELPVETRMLFIGLWTLADRDGRLADRPKQIRMEIYPADVFDVDAMLQALHDTGFILRYEVSGIRYIQVNNFLKHQNPHHREPASSCPSPGQNGACNGKAQGKPEASPSTAVLIPDSGFLIPDSRGEQQQGAATVGARAPDPKTQNQNQNQNPPELPPMDAESAPDPAPPPRPETPSAGQNPPRPEPIADAITMRAVDIAALLRDGGAALQPGDPRVRRWAERGDSDAVLLQALATANLRRDARQSPQPVNAGLLDSILDDAPVRGGLTPPARASPATARADWVRAMCPNIAAKTGGEHGRDSGITIDGVADAVG